MYQFTYYGVVRFTTLNWMVNINIKWVELPVFVTRQRVLAFTCMHFICILQINQVGINYKSITNRLTCAYMICRLRFVLYVVSTCVTRYPLSIVCVRMRNGYLTEFAQGYPAEAPRIVYMLFEKDASAYL